MDNKADVKAIMARFNTGGNSMEGVPGGRPKVPVHPTFSSGPPPQAKKPALESSLSGGAAPGASTPKSNFLKSTVSTKSAPEVREFPKPKPLASKFGSPQEDGKFPVNKPQPLKPKPPEPSRDPESKPPFPKPPLQKPSLSATLPDTKPAIPKPPPVVSKPPWLREDTKSEEGGGSIGSTPPKMPTAPKPKSTMAALRSQAEEGSTGDSTIKPFPGTPLKPPGFRAAQNVFNKEGGDAQREEGVKDGVKPLNSHDSSFPKPSANRKPSFLKKAAEQKENDSSAPKRNPLPNKLALGSAPAKPNRPPVVNLDKFKKGTESMTDGPGFKKASPPPPPISHSSNPVPPPLPSHPLAPSLPPRPTGAIIQPDPDENYDDVGLMNNPPPLPCGGHPSQRAEESGSDEEMYEDLDDRWSTMESKEQEKKREKEEKKRLEQEKKEQKEREKKEQEARKKFKLSGPMQVIHKVKARVDCRGGKMDLAVKQGESIEIIRITDNPEGRWLGRTSDGSYGYVKTESVEIDFDTLKRTSGSLPGQKEEDPDVYDDIGTQDDFSSGVKGPGVILPPPPEEDGDIYDDLEDPELNVRVPPPPQFTPEGNTGNASFILLFSPQCLSVHAVSFCNSKFSNNQAEVPYTEIPYVIDTYPKVYNIYSQYSRFNLLLLNYASIPSRMPTHYKMCALPCYCSYSVVPTDKTADAIDDEIYDDVESQGFPPAPSLISLTQIKSKAKMEEKDPKKQKKFEKEEKEFRKKFKFDGEIQVLYQVTIISTLTNKKWGSKDLPLRPGETLDVIVKPVENKMICRNEEGKFGYVSTSNIVAEDADIYDDIGEGCIYDND
ncbi:FYN-binding protein 1 isoform X2 [Megalops cyprinoides]|uniref:FYN-binding protein 1 isoform X2 n=1 Tax=Megalops cyprinoides TaxID=118141 RepID=UPI001863BC5E|nr:FYN-binding protein 1 isoform X2 [Megalops cyprinoides]